MDHEQSLARATRQAGAKSRPGHRRRHSLSRSLATWGSNSGRRMSGWVGKVYGSSPRGASRPLPPAPPVPGRYPQNPRLSLLSFSTPSLLSTSFHIPPTPPPSPPVSVSLVETSFQRTVGILPRIGKDFSSPQQVGQSSRLPTPPESQRSPSELNLDLPALSLPQTSPLPSDLPLHTSSDLKSPQSRLPTPSAPQTSSPPPEWQSSHSRARSLSASLADSLTILGRRRRSNSPAVPLNLKITTRPPTPPPQKQKKRLSRRATSSHPPPPPPPPPPPIPQKYLHNTLPVPVLIPSMDSVLLPELEFSQSPLMATPMAPPTPLPKSPLKRRNSKVPGSPVRTGISRNMRVERRSVIMQPSERENREFTKQNTIKVQRRLAEVEAARMGMGLESRMDGLHAELAVPNSEEERDSYTSLDGILSSYASSSNDSVEKDQAELQALLLSPLRPSLSALERYAYLGAPPVFQLPIASPAPRKWLEIKPIVYKQQDPQTPVRGRRDRVYGNWVNDTSIGVSVSSSTVSLDIEVAFSSLGGFGSGGIWRKIGILLEPWDLARLTRVSKRVKRAVEPLLYESVNLRPNYPHGFSYSYLSHLLSSLHSMRNKAKLQKWTRSFRLGKGWEENQVSLLDNGVFLMDAEIIDERGVVVVSKESMRELVEEEGLLGDGGIKQVNAYMSDILERATGLTSLVWDSPVPLRGQLISTIAAIKSINTLELNILQPVRKERRKDGTPLLQWANLAKYRPNIQALSTLPLVELRLSNLPTRGGRWWKQLWHLVASSVDTLRILALEMPHINHERYQHLFDRYHRIYHIPEHGKDERHLKIPPVFDWNGYNVARLELGRPDKKLRIHTLELTGFVVDEKIINWEIQSGSLKNLVLLGCIERAGFRITKDCWRGIEVFKSTGLGFMERVIESLYTSTSNSGKRKSICFLTDQHEHTEREALGMLRRVVINAFPRCGVRIEKLVLKEQWALGKEELEKVFSGVERITQIAVAIENSTDAWRTFLDGLGRCRSLNKVHVLNGFSNQPGSGYGNGTGGRRRFVINDAETIAEALVEAWEQGSGIQLAGFVVAVSTAAWRVVRVPGGGWGIVRIPGALKKVVVGSDDLS